jgi:hypothetical protein
MKNWNLEEKHKTEESKNISEHIINQHKKRIYQIRKDTTIIAKRLK